MTRLDTRLLSRIYREVARDANAGVWIAVVNKNVEGFITGCTNTRRTFLRVIIKLFLPLTFFALKTLFNLTFFKFARVVFYPFIKVKDNCHFYQGCGTIKPEILSLAVNKTQQNIGIGKQLILGFEKALKSWQYEGFYKVATDISETGSNPFYLRSGFSPCHKIKLNELILQVYVKETGL